MQPSQNRQRQYESLRESAESLLFRLDEHRPQRDITEALRDFRKTVERLNRSDR
jgi:hypothetical protein